MVKVKLLIPITYASCFFGAYSAYSTLGGLCHPIPVYPETTSGLLQGFKPPVLCARGWGFLYRGFTVVLPWFYRGFKVGLPWFYRGFTVVLPWFYCGFTVVLPWFYSFSVHIPR